jgi:phenylacetate-CoA ligase
VTPGNNKAEIFRVVQALGPEFEQVVLLGYPPFIKDVVDTGIAQGVRWPDYRIKMVFAGEVFSEEWRSLVCERVGAVDPAYETASLYGTADAGVLGNETPLSISIRRFLASKPDVARELFGESRLPTLVQYDSFSRYFEVDNGTLLFSGDNGIPLVRYHIADSGGVISFERMLEFARDRGWKMSHELNDGGRGMPELPFVYVFGRSMFAVSFYGANVYPENVMVGLEQGAVKDWVTGKFVMEVVEVDDRNRRLKVTVELAPSVEASDEKCDAIAESILASLRRLNSEFANYVPIEDQAPVVDLKQTGDAEYFPVGIKHRYTR